jgi:hypothetical protein
MDLRAVLDLCQEDEAAGWRVMPSGPAERMVTGLLDVAGSDEPPALVALQPDYRAIYMPDARLGIAWGIPDADARDERALAPPDWMPAEWSSARPAHAVVLLNGSAVWQVLYASVNWGAGISGYMPWPAPHYADGSAERPAVVGWRTTSWEASFARLLTRIAGHREFRSRTEEVAAGMLLEQRHPLDS